MVVGSRPAVAVCAYANPRFLIGGFLVFVWDYMFHKAGWQQGWAQIIQIKSSPAKIMVKLNQIIGRQKPGQIKS